MLELRETRQFSKWLANLRDPQAQHRVMVRMRRLSLGNPGDAKPVGEGISEMRIDYGPGYRVYYKPLGSSRAVLLCGGTKGTQDADIKLAHRLASDL
jgi:putative addiction module killer protein